MSELKRAKIICNGLVQGVGFRYFVIRHAQRIGLKGYTQNLFTSEVLTVVEGDEGLIQELIKELKVGPSHAQVNKCAVEWSDYKGEFKNFDVRY
ncbi:MAG TPA: acylphosphatase [Ignavibacteriaceae bacterium]|nr:acylphosphatase [Ignavibacteriaceae bacterium]